MVQTRKTQQVIILYVSYIWRSTCSGMILYALHSYLYFKIMVFFNIFSHTQVFFFLVGWLFSLKNTLVHFWFLDFCLDFLRLFWNNTYCIMKSTNWNILKKDICLSVYLFNVFKTFTTNWYGTHALQIPLLLFSVYLHPSDVNEKVGWTMMYLNGFGRKPG